MEIEIILFRGLLVVAAFGLTYALGYRKGRDDEKYKDTPRSLHNVKWPAPIPPCSYEPAPPTGPPALPLVDLHVPMPKVKKPKVKKPKREKK